MTAAAKVVIVGSGIIGASTALACQDLGAEVIVVDQGPLGGVASANSFGWINASFAENQAYFDLRNAALETFRGLGQRLELQAHVSWPGTLWWEDVGQDFEAQFASLTARGYGARRLDHDEIAALEPNLRRVSSPCAVHAHGRGRTGSICGAVPSGACGAARREALPQTDRQGCAPQFWRWPYCADISWRFAL